MFNKKKSMSQMSYSTFQTLKTVNKFLHLISNRGLRAPNELSQILNYLRLRIYELVTQENTTLTPKF